MMKKTNEFAAKKASNQIEGRN